jgi:hypothetical protein
MMRALRRLFDWFQRKPVETDLSSYQKLVNEISRRGQGLEAAADSVLDRLSAELISTKTST